MSFRAKAVVAALFAAATVGLGTLVAHRLSGRPDADAVPRPITETDRSLTDENARLAEIISSQKLRMAEIENRLTTLEGHPPPSPPTVATPSQLPTAAERAEKARGEYQEHQARLAQSAAEPRNERWASAMEQKIGTMFQRVPDTVKARYQGAECRSTTCAVRFSWPSREIAQGELRLLVSSFVRTGCGSAISLPPDGTSGALTADVLLRCAAGDDSQNRNAQPSLN